MYVIYFLWQGEITARPRMADGRTTQDDSREGISRVESETETEQLSSISRSIARNFNSATKKIGRAVTPKFQSLWVD